MTEYFKGMRNAPVFDRGVYLEAGYKYKLKILRTFIKATREHGDAFIAEFEVLESTGGNKPGTKASFYQGLQKKDIAFGELKCLTYAALGLDRTRDADKIAKDVDPVIEPMLQDAVDKNSMAGAVLWCETVAATAKQSGKPITRHNWAPAA